MQCDVLCAKLAKRKLEVQPHPFSVSLGDSWTQSCFSLFMLENCLLIAKCLFTSYMTTNNVSVFSSQYFAGYFLFTLANDLSFCCATGHLFHPDVCMD